MASDVQFSVISLNVANQSDGETIFSGLVSAGLEQADAFILQELPYSEGDCLQVLTILAHKLGGLKFVSASESMVGCVARSLAILSRHPLTDTQVFRLPRFDRVFNPRSRIALVATVHIPFGAVRLFNLHLDTRINSRERLEQLRPLLEAASAFQGPSIIGGDFNTADVFWVGHILPLPFADRQGDSIRAAMETYGFQTPFLSVTSTTNLPRVKLDWMYVRDLQVVSWGVHRIGFSDHRGLSVQVAWFP